MNTNKMKDVLMLIISLFIIFSIKISNIKCYTFLGFYLLIINVYGMVKYKKNKPLFILFYIIFYFNYSYVVSKYMFMPSTMFEDLYVQIKGENTLLIGILLEILFMTLIVFLPQGKIRECNDVFAQLKNIKFKNRKCLVLIIQILLVAILLYHIINNITKASVFLEYSIYLFIFGFAFCRDDKLNQRILECILLLFVMYSIKNGERIGVLQFLLVDFLINYLDKFSLKQMISMISIGILLFTMFGIYGDKLRNGKQTNILDLRNTYNIMIGRRFALDTSVCAYFSGLVMIDLRDRFDLSYRTKDGIDYLIVHSIFGSSSGYKPLNQRLEKYEHNVGGGMLVSYFYFWFGVLGTVAISLFIAKFLAMSNKKMGANSLYYNLLCIFIISTTPRWYLYEPNLLFRGVLIFNILYIFIYYCFLAKSLNNDFDRNN